LRKKKNQKNIYHVFALMPLMSRDHLERFLQLGTNIIKKKLKKQ